MKLPERIVCLSAETTEVIYLLGEQDRLAGISGYTVYPPIARKEKPKVAAFASAKIDKILELKPDLVIGFSDLQAEIAAELIRAGVEVHVFNQRSIAEMLNMTTTVGALLGAEKKAAKLVQELKQTIAKAKEAVDYLPAKPKIYFEEWNDPIITGIKWVGELIDIAGGEDCFSDLSIFPNARDRIVADDTQITLRQPDIIIGSWCGKKFQPEQVMARPGWATIPAVKNGFMFEIKSADILQPGPITHHERLKTTTRHRSTVGDKPVMQKALGLTIQRSTLILGGARSGKSTYAEKIAADSGLRVIYIATAQVYDAEFGARVQHHKTRRPAHWQLVEEPHRLTQAIAQHAAPDECLIVDCLTLWLAQWICPDCNPPTDSSWELEREAFLTLLPTLPDTSFW